MSRQAIELGVVAFIASLAMTGVVRRYALSRGLLDRPNERSLHSVATPRGGGLAIVLVVLTGIGVMAFRGALPIATAVALAGGGALVAGVGFLDDRRGMPARVRFGIHLLAAAWAVWWLGGMTELTWESWTSGYLMGKKTSAFHFGADKPSQAARVASAAVANAAGVIRIWVLRTSD